MVRAWVFFPGSEFIEGYHLFEVYEWVNGSWTLAFNATRDARDVPFTLTWRIPEDANGTRYLLLLAAARDGELVDLACSSLEVPLQVVKARLVLDKEEYPQGGKLKVTIVNEGPVDIGTGYDYDLYRWNGTGWEPLPLFLKLHPVLVIVFPGSEFSYEISLEGLEPGLYKIVKSVTGLCTNIKVDVEAVFRVTEGEPG